MSTINTTINQTVTLGSNGYLSPLTITSMGVIEPTAAGATGLYVPTSVVGASMLNNGYIDGGNGVSHTSQGPIGGNGGNGVTLASSAALTNAGIVSGGAGGQGTSIFNHQTAFGGSGGIGIGIDMASGGTLVNVGTIGGGAGGFANALGGGPALGGAGGAGVYLDGGTLINSGTISGGAGGGWRGGIGSHPGAAGDAVQFGATAATLVVDPGAVFNGQVVANPSAADVLELAGTSAGTLSGLGSSFTNFHTVNVDAESNWTLAGANSLADGSTVTTGAGGNLAIDGSLDVSGTVDLAGAGSIGGAGTIAIDASSVLDVTCGLDTAHMSFLSGGSETLVVDSAASFGSNVGTTNYAGPQLQDFVAGDIIDLHAFQLAGTVLNYNATSGLLQISNTAGNVASLSFDTSSLGSGSFHAASDGSSGIIITHS